MNEKQNEIQGEQIVEIVNFDKLKANLAAGTKTVNRILYGDGEYFTL